MAVKKTQMHVLLVDDDPANRCLFQVAQAELGSIRCDVANTDRLGQALRSGEEDPYDLILLDFPHSAALMVKTLVRLRAKAPGIPIVLLTDEDRSAKPKNSGEGELGDRHPLARAVQYVVDRSRLKESLPRLAFLDDLTGLCNRRGFFLLADHQLRAARRSKGSLLLLFADLDGLKQINDALGHREGDRALMRTAEVLSTTFRTSDVIGRLGGDEFGVLTLEDSGQSSETVIRRLLQRVDQSNASCSDRHVLSLSIGVARFDPAHVSSLEELLARADVALYKQKRSKQSSQFQVTQATPQTLAPSGLMRLEGTGVRNA